MDLMKRIAIIGCGNWGSAIATIVGFNAQRHSLFHREVRMYVHEELVNGRKLSEIINETHENVKYLPGYKLPENVIADPNLLSAIAKADILIFVTPFAFIPKLCQEMKPGIKRGAIGISLVKSFAELPGGDIGLISLEIHHALGIEMSVLMGANLAHEVANGQFCETTIGTRNPRNGRILKHLFETDNFRVTSVGDVFTVEACGAIKNIIGCAAGLIDGLGASGVTKSAIIRIGLTEMIRFCKTYFPSHFKYDTIFESCGVADLITTCYGGRNRKLAELFVKTGKSIGELEKEYLNGQRWEGFRTSEAMVHVLTKRGQSENFPLFMAVYKILSGQLPASKIFEQVCLESEK